MELVLYICLFWCIDGGVLVDTTQQIMIASSFLYPSPIFPFTILFDQHLTTLIGTIMALRQLKIQSEDNVALEGFLADALGYITGGLHGTLSPKDVTRIVGEAFAGNDPTAILKRVEPILKQTLGNKTWVAKSAKPRKFKPTSEYLFISGKSISDPVIAANLVTGDMFKGAEAVVSIFKENTKARQHLIGLINKLGKGDAKKADQIYTDNQSKIPPGSAEHYVKAGGKLFKSVDDDPKAATWPVAKVGDNYRFINHITNKSSPSMDYVSSDNAADWYKAIVDLINCAGECSRLYKENYISYWEACEVDYNEMKYGDEIFEKIYSSQDPYPASVIYELGNISIKLARDMVTALLAR